jgi:hypothetical protein
MTNLEFVLEFDGAAMLAFEHYPPAPDDCRDVESVTLSSIYVYSHGEPRATISYGWQGAA